MDLTLWIIASLLAAVALTGGISKTLVPKEKLAHVPGGGWTEEHSSRFVTTLGVLELLAVAGLILPAALDVAPVLVPITAVCWAAAHGRRRVLAPPAKRARVRNPGRDLPPARRTPRVGSARPALFLNRSRPAQRCAVSDTRER
jgi:hypothetical protein